MVETIAHHPQLNGARQGIVVGGVVKAPPVPALNFVTACIDQSPAAANIYPNLANDPTRHVVAHLKVGPTAGRPLGKQTRILHL